MPYLNSTINNSPTIVDMASVALEKPAMLAMSYTAEGKLALTSAGGLAMGITVAETNDTVPAGEDVTVVVKDITHWRAGAAIDKGAELASDANGKAVPAASGDFILAIALEDAGAADDIISVQVVKAGYKA